jgi:hypothetical protein
MSQQAAGWYSDPTKVYMYRYWNGTQWSDQVSSGGTASADPNQMDPSAVSVPPAPGSEAKSPPQPSAAPAPAVQVTQSSGSSFGTIIGVLLAVVAIVVIIALVMNNSGGDSTTSTTAAPQAPATTVAP